MPYCPATSDEDTGIVAASLAVAVEYARNNGRRALYQAGIAIQAAIALLNPSECKDQQRAGRAGVGKRLHPAHLMPDNAAQGYQAVAIGMPETMVPAMLPMPAYTSSCRAASTTATAAAAPRVLRKAV